MKSLLTICIIAFFFISGCNTPDTIKMNDSSPDMEQLDPQLDKNVTNDEISKQLGFVRYTKEEYDRRLNNNPGLTMDRMEMANMITGVLLQTDDFIEVATLVTDQEVLIAYEKNQNIDEQDAAEMAKKTAKSSMPRFFDVYVTDNDSLIKDIQSLHNSTTQNKDYDNTIESIINEMNKSLDD